MPRDEVEGKMVILDSLEKRAQPIRVKGSSRRAANFKGGRAGTSNHGTGSIKIKIVVVSTFPRAEEIGLVPNFVINATNTFIHRIMTGGGGDEVVPISPIIGRIGDFVVGG